MPYSAPFGISYNLEGDSNDDSVSNNLFTQYNVSNNDEKEVFVHMANFVSGKQAVGEMNPIPFTVPSGQLDNDVTLNSYKEQFATDDYCHPDIAFSSEGVASYKYWMISSIFPSRHDGTAIWEDEDMFVSNNGRDWMRIKSIYEEEKDYTAPGLSLPPQSLLKESSRRYAFLPNPGAGDTIEISVPEDNGAPALERTLITLSGLPWKHDPAIFIDNGYVYTYHSFHLSYDDRPSGRNRFIVCIRTSDGKKWEVVRTDGSTMPVTEETSRQLFTKDNQGRYNYIHYTYGTNQGNPKVLKYGEGDYELVYGYNFEYRVKGTTPYNFDFSERHPVQATNSGNHPALLLNGDSLYLLNNKSMFISTNRGETFTKYPHYPAWLGGLAEYPYKKSLCIGENGQVILLDVQRQKTTSSSKLTWDGAFTATHGVHQMYIYEYPSVASLVDKAQNGLVDGYIDLQVVRVNHDSSSRSTRFYPYISNLNTTSMVNNPMERLKIADISVVKGDILFLYVTLNSRNGRKYPLVELK